MFLRSTILTSVQVTFRTLKIPLVREHASLCFRRQGNNHFLLFRESERFKSQRVPPTSRSIPIWHDSLIFHSCHVGKTTQETVERQTHNFPLNRSESACWVIQSVSGKTKKNLQGFKAEVRMPDNCGKRRKYWGRVSKSLFCFRRADTIQVTHRNCALFTSLVSLFQ